MIADKIKRILGLILGLKYLKWKSMSWTTSNTFMKEIFTRLWSNARFRSETRSTRSSKSCSFLAHFFQYTNLARKIRSFFSEFISENIQRTLRDSITIQASCSSQHTRGLNQDSTKEYNQKKRTERHSLMICLLLRTRNTVKF